MVNLRSSLFVFLVLALVLVTAHQAWAGDKLLKGGKVYVPVYSNIYHGPKAIPLGLMAILSLRNTDPEQSIKITQVNYHNSKGELLKAYVDKEKILPPLGSADFMIPEKDKAGGIGANFIVVWTSDQPVNEPVIQALMISTRSSLGISFICPGKPIYTSK